ncbi:MAG TPA: hypothetical protein VEY09_15850 [Pyrinomonadaceae bacterium]|nr:hypothetical protein [Pyrinomonadaceae bacterium]
MRCIKCEADNKLKERQAAGGRCKACNHPFAFDPKVTPGVEFTDKFFQQSLAALSADGSLYFTPRQLYYFFNRRLQTKRPDWWKAAGWVALVAPLALVLLFLFVGDLLSPARLLVLLLIAGFGLTLVASERLRGRLRGNSPPELRVSHEQVWAWYDRWLAVNGDPGRMLPLPAQSRPAAGAQLQVNPEVLNYSFDRVVVCERAEVAQCLIANNFHFEHNCAVLGADGYPPDVFHTVMGMLRRNPSLSVYALHDASVRGVGLAYRLRTEERWFAGGGAKVYDLGLLPRQVSDRPLFVETWPQHGQPALTLTPEVAATLEPEEVRWLEAGNYVSLESFPPRTLLRVVAQGIAKSRDPQAADSLVPVSTGGDGGAGGGVFIYTTDTFG